MPKEKHIQIKRIYHTYTYQSVTIRHQKTKLPQNVVTKLVYFWWEKTEDFGVFSRKSHFLTCKIDMLVWNGHFLVRISNSKNAITTKNRNFLSKMTTFSQNFIPKMTIKINWFLLQGPLSWRPCKKFSFWI